MSALQWHRSAFGHAETGTVVVSQFDRRIRTELNGRFSARAVLNKPTKKDLLAVEPERRGWYGES